MPIDRSDDGAPVDPDWVWETDPQQRFTYLSITAEAFLGRRVASLIGKQRSAIAVNGTDSEFWDGYQAILAEQGAISDFLYPYEHPDGRTRWFRITGEPVFSDDGRFAGHRGIGTDISSERKARAALSGVLAELRAANAQLLEQNRRFDAALGHMVQGLCMFDGDSCLVIVNPRYCEIFGLSPDSVTIGMHQRALCELLIAQGCYRTETTVETLCESTRLALQAPSSAPLHRELADGRVLAVCYRRLEGGGWVATFEDITERRRNEARIAHMARHDALTDLPNRMALREHGLELLGEGRVDAPCLAMLCLDLDRFKVVNDTHGHGAGDTLLRAVAERLCLNVRTGDLVARLGGDEFAVLHRLSDEAGAMAMAQRLIATVSQPYVIGGYPVEIGMSVGLAIATQGADDIDRLLKDADTALYHAKADGRGRARLFETAMDENAKARRQLERDIAEALAQGDFEVHYQPLVDVESDCVTGVEALARWRHAERGLVSPTDFIPMAEDTGLIVALGEHVLNQACRDAAAWPDRIAVAVNVSAVQLRHRGFAQTVLLALATSGLRPERLELEITETVLLEDTEANLETLHLLRRAGIRIAMDDFGTGYSSLSYLRRFPFDKIKIDRSFVQDAGRTSESRAIIRALVGLGASLGIATLVEGVETAEQLAAVRAEGCHHIQGFLFSPARPAHEITQMLAETALPARDA